MAHIGLIACASKKRAFAAQARDLYDSVLFQKSREYVEYNCDSWYVLSAKHGLVTPTEIIAPYEETLNTKSVEKRHDWADRVWTSLQTRLNPTDRVTILAGQKYRENLVEWISKHGCRVEVPMEGMGIGEQLQWLTQWRIRIAQPPAQSSDLSRFYEALDRLEAGLGGKRLLGQCTARHGWPAQGVYFFFEPGETRSGLDAPRVVRIGTHGVSRGSRATLWNRLRTHRGTTAGHGNHRGSVFRLHVGAALAARDESLRVASWGKGQHAPADVRAAERPLEQCVSAHVGAMEILWVAVPDEPGPENKRAFLERNLIGLLAGSRCPADPPSEQWLGRHSPHHGIRHSGLWNLDHLDSEYSPQALDVFERYVACTLGE